MSIRVSVVYCSSAYPCTRAHTACSVLPVDVSARLRCPSHFRLLVVAVFIFVAIHIYIYMYYISSVCLVRRTVFLFLCPSVCLVGRPARLYIVAAVVVITVVAVVVVVGVGGVAVVVVVILPSVRRSVYRSFFLYLSLLLIITLLGLWKDRHPTSKDAPECLQSFTPLRKIPEYPAGINIYSLVPGITGGHTRYLVVNRTYGIHKNVYI